MFCVRPDPLLGRISRVAVILYTFTELALRFEWNRSPLARTTGRPDLEANPPALLFRRVRLAWERRPLGACI
jgi:hypothetical protein